MKETRFYQWRESLTVSETHETCTSEAVQAQVQTQNDSQQESLKHKHCFCAWEITQSLTLKHHILSLTNTCSIKWLNSFTESNFCQGSLRFCFLCLSLFPWLLIVWWSFSPVIHFIDWFCSSFCSLIVISRNVSLGCVVLISRVLVKS